MEEKDDEINYDKKCLEMREEKYKRKQTFMTQILKHFNKKCNCLKANKKCILKGTINMDRFNDEKYLETIYNNGTLDSLYNIFQSITQSSRCKAGKDFENCIEDILKDIGFIEGENYAKQIFISDDGIIKKKKSKDDKSGHTVDFMIPCPEKYPMKLKDFQGEIISCKTTMRERYLQDKFYGNFTLISLEKIISKDINSIQVNSHTKELTIWLNDIKEKYLD